MRIKTLLLKWTSLSLLVMIIIYSGQLLPTVTVIAPTDIIVIDKEKSPSLKETKTVQFQDGKLPGNDPDINLNNGQDLRKEVDVNLKSQMNYVPENRRDESHSQGRSETGKTFESQKAGAPENSIMEKSHQVINDKRNIVDMMKKDQGTQLGIKNDVVELKAGPEVSGADADIPKTFNEQYIRYFWKHPELYKNFLEFNKTLKTQEIDNKVTDPRKQETNGKADILKTESKQSTYITVDTPRGKLGNQMFQMASLIGIAAMKNLKPILPFHEFNINKVFKQPFQPSLKGELKNFMRFTDENKTTEVTFNGIKQLDINKNWTLDGYFQSFRYFQHIEDEVRQLFEFRDIYLTAARKFIRENVHAFHVKIAIHIRRQDFISSYQVKLGRVEVPAGKCTLVFDLNKCAKKHCPIIFIYCKTFKTPKISCNNTVCKNVFVDTKCHEKFQYSEFSKFSRILYLVNHCAVYLEHKEY